MIDFGLTESQFWRLTPAQFSSLADRFDQRYDQERRHLDFLAGIVAATIANVNRGKAQKAFKPEDFMPKYEDPTEDGAPSEKGLLNLWQGLIMPAFNETNKHGTNS